MKAKKGNKRRASSDLDRLATKDTIDNGPGEVADELPVNVDLNEPTMGEKLASLNLLDNNMAKGDEEDSLAAKPPSADSVHVMLKQALHADDRALLLDCLYYKDEKVIAKSVSQLHPSHVVKLLHALISIIQSRGAILVCALLWLRCLLVQHTSGIMSQESSLLALNSLCQLIESRVSTFHKTLQLSSVLDWLYTEVDDVEDEYGTPVPVIYEDKDESDEDESEDAMETEHSEDSEDDKGFDVALVIFKGAIDVLLCILVLLHSFGDENVR